MHYEPIGYIYEYEIGALAVFLVIMLRYFSARRFPNQKNRLYALILSTSVADIVLDVVSAIVIDNVFRVPLYVTYFVNTAFYAITIVMLLLMTLYTLALSEHIDRRKLGRMFPLFLPALAVILLLVINPLTDWFFYVDPVRGYVRGKLFAFSYGACFFYLALTFFIVFRRRAALRREEYNTILLFLTVVLLATLAQYLFPALLITGVAIALSVVLMYFTIQNPESMTDVTTGAFTYEAMLTFLRDRLQAQEHVQIAAVKIHNMSRINDLLGIENGSVLLRGICSFLNESAAGAWVFRMRGSCFVAITRKKEDYDVLRTRLERRIGQPWMVNGTEVLLQAAVCCAETEHLLGSPISPEEAIGCLETAFMQSEHDSGRIVFTTAGMELFNKMKRNNAVEAALRDALSSGDGLELYFQPLWSIRQKCFVSAEVLLRFRHPVMGMIPPEEFVAIAENNGLITALDEYVVRKTCSFIHRHDELRNLGLSNLEINLSALEFMHHRLPALLQDIMAQYHVDPSFLCFEVTETAATVSFELLQECMADIKRFGCQFALDDFGTGYANISQVIQLPFSIVKLDRSMLSGPIAVLEDLVRMFARIDRKTVVEGVETAEQNALVSSFGVDMIQGFYYAKPLNEESFVRFMLEHSKV